MNTKQLTRMISGCIIVKQHLIHLIDVLNYLNGFLNNYILNIISHINYTRFGVICDYMPRLELIS